MKVLKTALIGAAALLSTGAFASNMGFKLVYPLSVASGGSTGTNWVSIPYFNSFTTASTVFADIPNCTQVSRYVSASDSYEDYTGGPFDPDFTLTKGEALLIKVGTAGNWTLVGSHDNAYAVSLAAAAGGNTGTNWVSLPYHTNKTTASTLFAEIPNVTQISRFVSSNDSYEDYTGGPFDPDFAITIGEGLLIKVGTTGNWTPAHY